MAKCRSASLNMLGSAKRPLEVFWKEKKKGMEVTKKGGKKERRGGEEGNKNRRTFINPRLIL